MLRQHCARLAAVTFTLLVAMSCNSPTEQKDLQIELPLHSEGEVCPWGDVNCKPYSPDSSDVSGIRSKISVIYNSQCDISHSLEERLTFLVNEGRLKWFDGTYYSSSVGGDYHEKGEAVWPDEIHINDDHNVDSDNFLRMLVHEGRHAIGESHPVGENFPDEEQVLTACSGP